MTEPGVYVVDVEVRACRYVLWGTSPEDAADGALGLAALDSAMRGRAELVTNLDQLTEAEQQHGRAPHGLPATVAALEACPAIEHDFRPVHEIIFEGPLTSARMKRDVWMPPVPIALRGAALRALDLGPGASNPCRLFIVAIALLAVATVIGTLIVAAWPH
jgi:hypothetical protein